MLCVSVQEKPVFGRYSKGQKYNKESSERGDILMNKFYGENKGFIVSGAAILILGLCFFGANIPSVLADDASTSNTATKAAQGATPPATAPAPATEANLIKKRWNLL